MKKGWWKRALGVGLACSLAAGLCACGKGGKNANSALAKENVYKMEEFTVPDVGGSDYNVLTSTYVDDTVYLLIRVYHWDDGGPDTDIKLLSMKEDGSDTQMTTLEIPEWEPQIPAGDAPAVNNPIARTTTGDAPAEPESEGEEGTEGEDSEGTGGEAGTEDGEGTGGEAGTEDSEGIEGEAGTEDGEGTEGEAGTEDGEGIEGELDPGFIDHDDEYVPSNVWENNSYNYFAFGADGRIYAIRNYYYEDYNSGISIQEDYVSSWNKDGSFQWETELEGLQSEEEYIYVNTMAVAGDGTVTLILGGENAYKMTVDAQGNQGAREPLSEEVSQAFNNYDRIVDKGDGTFLVLYYDENDWTKEYITTYDPATDTLGEPSPMPDNFGYGGYGNMTPGKNSDLICTNSNGIYSYKIGDADLVQKMSYINSDLFVANMAALVELDDSRFLGVYYDSYESGADTSNLKAGIFTYVDPKDVPDKAVIVLAGNWIGSDMKKRVIDYNRASDEYRIVIKNYDSYNTYDDYQAGYTQLNNDITSGNMPDILITDGLPVENYVAKGLLADIGALIEKDEELSQVEFVQNVFDAYSVDGKLHYVIPNFTVSTMIGKQSIVGDRTSWTMDDMIQLQNSLPEGTNMIGELTREGFFSTMMQFCGSDFVDVDTGKCDFDTQNFISMMEFAKTLPEELGEEYYGQDYWANYESQYRDGRTILSRMSIGSIRDINYNVNGYFGGDVAYIGFPTESGMGSYVMANECYAISSRSGNIEGAWEFLRYYLTDEYQSGTSFWGLPTQKKYFDEKVAEATQRPYYLDENGNKVEYDNYFYMNGEEILLDPLSQEQIDQVVSFILSVDKCYYYNESIMNIINEEMDAFYTGQKTAQEVAKIIQNRAQVYVDENR